MKIDHRKDEGYHKAVEYVKQHGDTMNFATVAERRDYERQVKANPGNVMGIPAFLPPLKIVSVAPQVQHDCSLGHRWSNTAEKFCTRCFIDKPTESR